MHLLALQTQVRLSDKTTVEPGEYVVEDVSGAQLLTLAGGGIMTPLTERRPFDDEKDWNGKNILFVRTGGFGDLVLLTPVLREVARRWPGAVISVASMANHYGPVLQHLPFVHEIVSYPVPLEKAKTFDAWVFFERAIEKNPRAQKIHMTDLFAEITGLNPRKEGFWKKAQRLADYHPAYAVTEEEATWAKLQYPRTEKTRICIQVGSSAMCRTYPGDEIRIFKDKPPHGMQVVVGLLAKKGYEVFLMGQRGEVQGKDTDNVKVIANAGLTFRQSCAVLSQCDCVLGSDSALIHVAGALDVPAVGLYGPFPHELRTKHSPSVICLQGQGNCAPCFHHVHLKQHFPAGCPTASHGFCGVLASIAPDRIVMAVERQAKTKRVRS